MLEYFIISFLVAIFGIVMSEVLMQPGMILEWYAKILDKFPGWLSHPLGLCIYCFTGQVAFWLYIFHFDYNLFYHISFVTLSIFYTLIYIKWK